MARVGPRILLGFDDECISEKYKSSVNFATNKIGGKPNWPHENVSSPLCHLCGLSLPLILQIYAPIENSSYHRTLYLFGCINPNCWNQSESWVCVRTQTLETRDDKTVDSLAAVNTMSSADWCTDADDWEDDNNANNNEENGNVIKVGTIESCGSEKFSDDEDDEKDDFEEDDTVLRFEQLRVGKGNANWNGGSFGMACAGAQGDGAVGRLHSPSATAEIEGDESEHVSIDTPTAPQHDLVALLQEVTPLPMELCLSGYTDKNGCVVPAKVKPPQFLSFFLSVGDEGDCSPTTNQEHVRELLQEYQQNNEEGQGMTLSPDLDKRALASGQGDNPTLEKYERGIPSHGDWMFHEFLSRIQTNPGQIMRYCRESSPLLLSPIPNPPARCRYCRGEMIFEFQVLPTLVTKLSLKSESGQGTHLEFGTVLVYACQRSCWAVSDTAKEEVVIVQAERM